MIRLPPNLHPGAYRLEVMVGGDGYVEVDRDTMTVYRAVDYKKEQVKGGDRDGLEVRVGPQPALLGAGDITVGVKAGSRSAGFCSVRLYDVAGRLVRTAFADRVSGPVDLAVTLDGLGGAPLAPGVYLLSVKLEDDHVTRKVVLLRP